ncbi:collagen alpha-1(XXV) chain-like [Pristis pectinata]|uniref:collagen alpha-1(XXV) chain-like n=1 Tax=Pristis pectinata TaxID=685728 RepID=UPI00223CAB6C|nr:collagen alpha-1(XXV) chain-like [Pristis pectinata]
MPKTSVERSSKRQVEGAGAARSPALGVRGCWTLSSAVWSVLSLGSVAFCICLSVKTSQLEERILDLENVKGAALLPPLGPGSAADRMRVLVQERVDHLLSQRFHEESARRRTAREASTDCSCPAGPPGKRGRRGRNGEPGKYHIDIKILLPHQYFVI